ncbi:MAG: ThiF family adenylyltransferase [Bernardetiaceae bacterium]
MKKFQVGKITDPEESYFDRQTRMEWWDQERLSQAKVMVVGAGAIGNETLKNLALLGVRQFFIADFDTISSSNLSRTVLFRRGDEGKQKAALAAERIRELALAEDVRVDCYHGDVVWELGTGVFGAMDLVLGCLDNVETRLAVGRQCQLSQTPWIDAGIFELGLRINVYQPDVVPCYFCTTSPQQRSQARARYSCDDFKRQVYAEGKIPTTQIASAMVAALQVQEAVKLLCGQPVSAGQQLYFQGKTNEFDAFGMTPMPECREGCAHIGTYPEVISLPLSSAATLEQFLIAVEEHSGPHAVLDFRGDRTFVQSIACRCSERKTISMMRPSFRIFDHETICAACRDEGKAIEEAIAPSQETIKETLEQFGRDLTPPHILQFSLHDLGVPYLHVLAVQDSQGAYQYYRLDGDYAVIFPELSR